jgi:uncharacterized protein (TIGR00106 family)
MESNMKILAEVCVIPLNGSISLRKEIAIAHEILRKTGCTVALHGYGTNIEGEYETIMNVIKEIHETLHQSGTPRIHTSLKISSRIDKEQNLDDKIEAVSQLIKEPRWKP